MEKKIYSIKLKEIIRLSLILAALFISSAMYGQPPTNGLKLYYDFEAVSGTSVPDPINSLNGTLMGAATVATGKVGSNGVNCATKADYILLPNDVTSSLTDFTISAWVKFDAVSMWSRIFDFGTGQSTNMFLTPKGGGNKVRFAIKYNGGAEQQIDGTEALPTGKWVHVTVTLQGSKGTLYVNGTVVGTNNGMTITPGSLGSTTQNYIGKSQYDDPALAGTIDEFRIYNRAVTNGEVLQLMGGVPAELTNQYLALSLGDLSAVKTNLNMKTVLGTGGVTASWTSSNTSAIATDGTVNRPDKYDVVVTLTAVLRLNTDSLIKVFTATVAAVHPPAELLARWNFKDKDISQKDGITTVKDASGSGFVGTLKDVASIRTIGKDTLYNVLDLGENKGYFDMDTAIGQAIYSLKNYFVGAYYYIDSTYTSLNSWGNCLWSFSNAVNQAGGGNGVMFMSLKYQGNVITPTGYNTENGPKLDVNAPKGRWTHIGYSQDGDSGRLFVDGVQKKAVRVAVTPSSALTIAGRVGTRFNTIGVPAYVNDSYLKKTLVYDFQLYRVALSGDDLIGVLGVADTVSALNRAYSKNIGVPASLTKEWEDLSFPDLSAVKTDLTLPLMGATDTAVKIRWASTSPLVLDTTGVVTRPDYINTAVSLTATLTLRTYSLTKVFKATVLATDGTGYTSDLLLNYNFAGNLVSGTTVTDAAEKHFSGTLMNGATVDTIGNDLKFNVLNLGTDTAYFDMGTECGKVIYGLSNYSISVFFLIDSTKTNLKNNGNFIYSFANSNNSNVDQNGYMFGRASNLIQSVAVKYWNSGNMQTTNHSMPDSSRFHHMVFTQNGNIGTVYYDGDTISSGSFANIPSVALPKTGLTGTLYNWLGKSSYVGDAYLAKALIADFKLYKKALKYDEVQAMKPETRKLTNAYKGLIDAVLPVTVADNLVISTASGKILFQGLKGDDKVSLFNLLGQKSLEVQGVQDAISVKPGFYIVVVSHKNGGKKVTKVIVR